MAETESTWIYHPTEPAKIVELPRGAALPKGWSQDPNVIADPARRTADAVSGIVAQVIFGADIETLPPGVERDADAVIDGLKARVAELDTIILGGLAENQRLDAELSGAADMVESASKEIDDLKAQLAGAIAAEERFRAQITELVASVQAEREKNAPLADTISRLEAERDALAAERDRLKAKRSER